MAHHVLLLEATMPGSTGRTFWYWFGYCGIIIGLVAIVVSLVILLIAQRRDPAPPPAALSPDGRYWWNGAAWVDAVKATPPNAICGRDGLSWWDGYRWRAIGELAPERARREAAELASGRVSIGAVDWGKGAPLSARVPWFKQLIVIVLASAVTLTFAAAAIETVADSGTESVPAAAVQGS